MIEHRPLSLRPAQNEMPRIKPLEQGREVGAVRITERDRSEVKRLVVRSYAGSSAMNLVEREGGRVDLAETGRKHEVLHLAEGQVRRESGVQRNALTTLRKGKETWGQSKGSSRGFGI